VSRIIVVGGGVCGLATGTVLARDGHSVTLLERDGAPLPESANDAWESWGRAGIAQFLQVHYLQPRGRAILGDLLPEVLAGLEAAGAVRFDSLGLMPAWISDRSARDGDERFVTLNARRPILEWVLGRVAAAQPGLEIRRGVIVRELLAQSYDHVPHVGGVRTDAGEELRADLVIDATGRRSQLPQWLAAMGAAPLHEEAEDSGFVYYTRYFRSPAGDLPEYRGPLLCAIGTFSVLVILADNGTWSVTVFASTGDKPLKLLRDADLWTALVRACPLHAQWLEGDPITGVLPIAGVVDRYRRLDVDGQPVATGIVPVGDALACTNPSTGRGMTLGLVQVQALRDAVRAHIDDPRQCTAAWAASLDAELTPWYRETVHEDRARFREIEALRNGEAPPAPSDRHGELRAALVAAAPHDPDVFRAMLAARCCLTLQRDMFADGTFVQRIREIAGSVERRPFPGPDREQVLQLLGGSVTAA
jgi:2-polyprenyl-6-methoxyphenol hydroxylase-like FAD-dependent oxidoreductase